MRLFAERPGWRASRCNPMAMTGLALVALVVSAALFALDRVTRAAPDPPAISAR